jgi:hypothetical protein
MDGRAQLYACDASRSSFQGHLTQGLQLHMHGVDGELWEFSTAAAGFGAHERRVHLNVYY